MNIDKLVENIRETVERHRIEPGGYRRWLWNNASGGRQLGVNEYGCADAANILYTIGCFEGDPAARENWVRTMQGMQDPETGLFHEATHHPFHTTAHVAAALELFDARPLYPVKAMLPYLDRDRLYAFLEGLDWEKNPWPQSHQGAGLFATLVLTRAADAQWQDWYFSWLRERCDPVTGISYGAKHGQDTLAHHLYGWFHYLFNHEYARRPMPYPDKMIDSCIALYDEGLLDASFGRECNFREIDWVFCLNRATRQTPHRFCEAKDRLSRFAMTFVDYLSQVDPLRDEEFNDLHMLFGAVCALAELQQALPGLITSTVPLKLVLDRRPFI